jgi:hypothetical protein
VAAVIQGYGQAPIHRKVELGVVLAVVLIIGVLICAEAWRNRAAVLAHIEVFSIAGFVLAGPAIALRVFAGVQADRQAAMTGWLSAAPLGQAAKRAFWRESAARAGLLHAAPLGVILMSFQIAAARTGWAAATVAVLLGAIAVGLVLGEAVGRPAGARAAGKGRAQRGRLVSWGGGMISGAPLLVWTAPRTRAIAGFLAVLAALAIAVLIISEGARPDGLGPFAALVGGHLVFIGLFRTPELIFSPLLQLSGSRFSALVLAVGVVAAAASLAAFSALAAVALVQGETQAVTWVVAIAALPVLNASWAVVAVAFPNRPALRQLAYMASWTGLGALFAAFIPLGILASALVFGMLWRRARQRFRGLSL